MKKPFVLLTAALAASVCFALTQTLVEGESLGDAIAAAKADYATTSEAQEIVLGAGTYELTAWQPIQIPLVIRSATGNPDDVTIDGKKKIQLFQLDHAGAAICSVTLKGGKVTNAGDFTPCRGGAVNIERLHGTGSGQEYWRDFYDGAGGMVSNCVITGCHASDKGVSGSAVACLSPNGLVTHCRIVGNTATRQSDSNNGAGVYVSLMRGKMRNSIVTGNREVKMSGDSRADKIGYAVNVGTAHLVNCTIVGNHMFGDYTGVINAGASAKVVNTVVAGNTLQTVEDHSSLWAGTAAAYVNCMTDGATAINETCGVATLADMKFLDVEGKNFRPLSGSALLAAGTTDAAYEYGTTDVYGRPRFREATIDGGAAQFDASAYVLECSFTPDAKLYAPRTATLAVTKALGFGDAPVYYWDFNGDGKTDLVTTKTSVTPTFNPGDHQISVCVSNDTATFGAKYSFAETFVVAAQPVRYVKAGNEGAAEPYDTEATAAADIQTCIDYCGIEEKIVVLKGVYNTATAVDVNKKLEVIGATGNPEDVIIHNTADGYRCLKVRAQGAFVASMSLENGKPDWDHDHTSSFRGTGAYVTSGTVSNLVVRSCTSKADSIATGAAITAEGTSSFVTHCVITNNTSSGASENKFYVTGIGLHLTGGAQAENCLVADNRTVHSSGTWFGWGHCAAFVGTGSRMRFCTVVGNRTALFGGIGTYGTGVFEECLVAGNTVTDSTLDNKARHAFWSAFNPETMWSKTSIATTDNQTAEATTAADIAANQVYDATDVDAHGLGATTVLTTTERLIRNLAKMDWRLAKGSPAVDTIPPASLANPPASDFYGTARPRNGAYDIGCQEADVKGLVILFR